jgi:AraC family transcriptional regulator
MTPLPLDALEILTAECASFSVEHIRIAERLHVPPHAHDGRHLLIITNGVLVETESSGKHEWSPGSIRFSPHSETHQMYVAQVPFSCLVISVRDGATTPFPATRGHAIAPELTAEAAQIGLDLAKTGPRALLRLSSGTAALMARAHHIANRRHLPATPSWLLHVCSALRERSAVPIRLDALAREAGVHPAHLSRAFRLHFGQTPSEFVREVRLSAALGSLETTSASISAIAADCGFADHAHLTRAARAHVGNTPSAIRRAAQRKVRSSASG